MGKNGSLRKLATAEDVVKALGGIHAVAEMTGAKYVTAHHWKSSGRFPPKTYIVLRAALAQKRCAAPDALWNMLEPI